MLNSGHRLPKLMFPKSSVSFDYSQVRDHLEQADQYLKMQRVFFMSGAHLEIPLYLELNL